MFNSVSAASTSSASFAEKSVAELLSSLASGNYASSQFSSTVLTPSSLVRGIVTTPSTPLLTPNSLTSIEQIIGASAAASSSGATDLSRESGFVPPVVNPTTTASTILPIKQEYPVYNFGRNMPAPKDDPDWEPSSKRVKVEPTYGNTSQMHNRMTAIPKVTPNSTVTGTGSRRPTGPRARKPQVDLSEEEIERRDIRRERNKLAAAKCRQRRVDITNTLLNESEGLEEEQANLEDEIEMLKQQKEQLEFLLEAHRPLCAKKINTPRPNTLSLPCSAPQVTEATGIAISTPSQGMGSLFSFGLDSMLESHTGLTPVTEGTSCASQVQRAAVLDQRSSSSGSDTLNSPTLMAL